MDPRGAVVRLTDMNTPEYPTDRFGLIHRDTALSVGFTDNDLAAQVRAKRLVRLVRGVYTLPRPVDEKPWRSEETLYRLRCIAVVVSRRHASATTLSHESAASLHRLGLLDPRRGHVHVTNTAPNGGGQIRGPRHVHAGPVGREDLTVVDGLQVTCLARTAADIARNGTFGQALTVFDSALRRGADRAEIGSYLRGRRYPGGPTARAALRYADGASESVGESWSRAQMIVAQFPLPRLQTQYRAGPRVYRLDFDWDGLLNGEFDGMVKYDDLLGDGETAEAVMRDEKRRELELRKLGFAVVRWDMGMLRRNEMIPMVAQWLDQLGLRHRSARPNHPLAV